MQNLGLCIRFFKIGWLQYCFIKYKCKTCSCFICIQYMQQECEQAAAWGKEYKQQINSLRDVAEELLNTYLLQKII